MDAITCEPMVDQQVLHSDLYEYVSSGTTLSAAIFVVVVPSLHSLCSSLSSTTNNTESFVSTLLP